MTPDMLAQAPGCPVVDVGCQTRSAVGSAFQGIITDVAHGAADLVVSMTGWWTTTSSVDPTDPAVVAAQGVTRPLILLILVGSVLAQSIRIILSRKGEPLIMVASGLVRYAAVSALGLVVLQTALKAGDDLAAQLLDNAVDNYAQLMQRTLLDANATFTVLLLSLIAAVLSLVQWVLMAMRQAGLLVLAAMLPLAASGSLTRSTRGWLDKLLAWLIAMVVYKPAAAFIYYIGFSYLSTTAATDPGHLATMITGLMVLLLAVVAMPVLLKFFAWSGTQVGGGNGGGSGFLGAAGAIAMSQGYGRGGSVDRATAMETSGPGSAGTPGPAGAAPAAGASGAAGQAGAAGAGEAAAGAAAAGPAAAVVAAGIAGRAAVQGAAGQMSGDPDGGGPA